MFILAPQPNEVLELLIRRLAERHSQGEIVRILNERTLYQPTNNRPWKQFSLSRYMKRKGIPAIYRFRGWREGGHDNAHFTSL